MPANKQRWFRGWLPGESPGVNIDSDGVDAVSTAGQETGGTMYGLKPVPFKLTHYRDVRNVPGGSLRGRKKGVGR